MAQYERQMEENPQNIAERMFGHLAEQPFFDQYMFGRWGNVLNKARNNAGFLARFADTYHIFGVMGAARLISPHLHRTMEIGRAPAYDLKENDELSGSTAIDRVKALCLRGYTQNQLLRDIDAMSMTHSLEGRGTFFGCSSD